jgi:glutathione S-transferase
MTQLSQMGQWPSIAACPSAAGRPVQALAGWTAERRAANLRHSREVPMFKLYYAPGTCALASHIALAEAGAPYTTEKVDFKTNQQNSPEYLEINPKARVPSLVTDHGILTETPAMLAFIAQSFPQAKLAPFDNAFAFAQVQAFNSYLCSTVHVAHAHKGRGYRWATDEASFADMKRMVPKSVGASFALIERNMLRGPWVMGETYTVCDPYLFTVAQWLEGDSVDLAALPKVADHRKRMSERPAVRKAMAEQQG